MFASIQYEFQPNLPQKQCPCEKLMRTRLTTRSTSYTNTPHALVYSFKPSSFQEPLLGLQSRLDRVYGKEQEVDRQTCDRTSLFE